MICENGVVIWDENSREDFLDKYDEFVPLNPSDAKLKRFFDNAVLIFSNSACPEPDCEKRIHIYELLIAWMLYDFARGAGLVGQITSATQGSVSLGLSSVDYGQFAAPFFTNGYGELFWLAAEIYRTFQYVPDPNACRRNRKYKFHY